MLTGSHTVPKVQPFYFNFIWGKHAPHVKGFSLTPRDRVTVYNPIKKPINNDKKHPQAYALLGIWPGAFFLLETVDTFTAGTDPAVITNDDPLPEERQVIFTEKVLFCSLHQCNVFG